MLFAEWYWHSRLNSSAEISLTVHNDVELGNGSGLYLMACGAFYVSGYAAYFGMQTQIADGSFVQRGKGFIFSRWDTRDLEDVRAPSDAFTESGGYEGQFVSVRRPYHWGEGTYTFSVVAEEPDDGGRWFSLHVTDHSADEKIWVGSLRFPGEDSQIEYTCFTTIEVYGRPVRPIDIPYWKVTVEPPVADGRQAYLSRTRYPDNVANLRNALITMEQDRVIFEVGLDYLAHD